MKQPVPSGSSFDDFRAAYNKWNEFNAEYLRRAFTTTEYADVYSRVGVVSMSLRGQSVTEQINDLIKRVGTKRDRLGSLIERLDLIDEQPGLVSDLVPVNSPALEAQPHNRKIFVVHGQDDAAKSVVARFLTGCGLDPIILHEQPNSGRTIIEKFEKEADVGFAVVLLTPDDVGGPRRGSELASDDLKARARQNVILELGYFAGRMGRGRVAALKKGEIEIPSDFQGVGWIAMDPADAWKMYLARELKAAGYDFDLGKALSI